MRVLVGLACGDAVTNNSGHSACGRYGAVTDSEILRPGTCPGRLAVLVVVQVDFPRLFCGICLICLKWRLGQLAGILGVGNCRNGLLSLLSGIGSGRFKLFVA
jgi:hypothetical protein